LRRVVEVRRRWACDAPECWPCRPIPRRLVVTRFGPSCLARGPVRRAWPFRCPGTIAGGDDPCSSSVTSGPRRVAHLGWSRDTCAWLGHDSEAVETRTALARFEATHDHACDPCVESPNKYGSRRIGRPKRLVYAFMDYRRLADLAADFGVATSTIRRAIERGADIEQVLLDAQDRNQRPAAGLSANEHSPAESVTRSQTAPGDGRERLPELLSREIEVAYDEEISFTGARGFHAPKHGAEPARFPTDDPPVSS